MRNRFLSPYVAPKGPPVRSRFLYPYVVRPLTQIVFTIVRPFSRRKAGRWATAVSRAITPGGIWFDDDFTREDILENLLTAWERDEHACSSRDVAAWVKANYGKLPKDLVEDFQERVESLSWDSAPCNGCPVGCWKECEPNVGR